MKIPLDSTILVRAFEDTGGLARRLLIAILDSNTQLVLSSEILAETSRVLRYPRMRARHRMPDSRIYDYVMFLHSVAIMIRPDPMLIAPIRDPNDIVVLQTAIIGGAEAICTTDEDFFNRPASAFLQSLGILVFTDAELMGGFVPDRTRACRTVIASDTALLRSLDPKIGPIGAYVGSILAARTNEQAVM